MQVLTLTYLIRIFKLQIHIFEHQIHSYNLQSILLHFELTHFITY